MDDVLHAMCAAVEKGIVAGGRVALAFKIPESLASENPDQKFGIDIVRAAPC